MGNRCCIVTEDLEEDDDPFNVPTTRVNPIDNDITIIAAAEPIYPMISNFALHHGGTMTVRGLYEVPHITPNSQFQFISTPRPHSARMPLTARSQAPNSARTPRLPPTIPQSARGPLSARSPRKSLYTVLDPHVDYKWQDNVPPSLLVSNSPRPTSSNIPIRSEQIVDSQIRLPSRPNTPISPTHARPLRHHWQEPTFNPRSHSAPPRKVTVSPVVSPSNRSRTPVEYSNRIRPSNLSLTVSNSPTPYILSYKKTYRDAITSPIPQRSSSPSPRSYSPTKGTSRVAFVSSSDKCKLNSVLLQQLHHHPPSYDCDGENAEVIQYMLNAKKGMIPNYDSRGRDSDIRLDLSPSTVEHSSVEGDSIAGYISS